MFPLFNLPRVPRDEVVKQIGFTELFHFSMLSKRCKTAVERAKVTVNRVKWITEPFEYRIYVQRLISDSGPKEHFTISMNGGPSPFREASSSQQFIVEENPNYYKPIDYTFKHTQFLLEHVSAHILKIFKPAGLIFEDHSCTKIPIFWYRLNLRFERVSSIKRRDSKDEPMSHESLKFFLDHINTDTLVFNYKLAPGFQYTAPLKCKKLGLPDANWFTLDNLLNTDCEKLGVGGSNITTADLDVFFKKWKDGDFPKLKSFNIYWPLGSGWDLKIEETDENGRQILTDVHGNRGTFLDNRSCFIGFTVNLQDD